MAGLYGGQIHLASPLPEGRRQTRVSGQPQTVEDISSIREETVALTVDVVDIVSSLGVRFPGSALPGIDLAEHMREARD